MKESIDLAWIDGMSFEADVAGYKLRLDSDPEHGGMNKGPKPKPLMMVALAGCTGMDVASILKKMHVEIDELVVEVEGDVSEEHPKRFTGMKVIYKVKGRDIPRDKVEKAVNLSRNNYCGVSANYSKAFPLDHEIIIEDSAAG